MNIEQFKKAEELYNKIFTAEELIKKFERDFTQPMASGSVVFMRADKSYIAEYSCNFKKEWMINLKKEYK